MTTLLGACSTANINSLSCPTYFEYPEEKQKAIAIEIAPDGRCEIPNTCDALVDYFEYVRPQITVCRK
jgi:hypothetical protein